MSNQRADEMVQVLNRNGGLMDYGTGNLHLLVQIVRVLAKGDPVTTNQVDGIIAELGIDADASEQFLQTVAERDDDDNIVGALGLSLKQHPHRFIVGGTEMTAWCAQDTLFLPVMLQQTATVETESPLSKEKIRITVGPQGVKEVSPAGTVMSTVILDPNSTDLNTPTEIQMNFCRNIHFFASEEEVEQWAAGRGDIETLSLDEAFDLGYQLWPEAYSYAKTLAQAASPIDPASGPKWAAPEALVRPN
jgi:alkylmercury lyase